MAGKLTQSISSKYIEAASRMCPRGACRKVITYVESYDDVYFWSALLRDLENSSIRFEVMLPSRNSLSKGKKKALMNELGGRLGSYMIACVDADYDYLMQDVTSVSRFVNSNPYVFHTYAYSIENFQCFAPSLRAVCTMATLNDNVTFDFETFLSDYSRIIFPLFVWNVWCYRKSLHKHFDLSAFAAAVSLENLSLSHPERAIEYVRGKVNRKISWLQRRFPQARADYKPLMSELRSLGVSPEETYMYMRGHDLHDSVITPMITAVADRLRRERESEIRRLAVHDTQMQNELSSYRRSSEDVMQTLRHHTDYKRAPLYKKVQTDISTLTEQISSGTPLPQAPEPPIPDYFGRQVK